MPHPRSAVAKVAYLVNQYPKVSHSFIRREILALEAAGLQVERYALRGWDGELADPLDVIERRRTRYLLRDAKAAMLVAMAHAAWRSPSRWTRALGLAVSLSRRGARPWPLHLVYFAEACLLWQWLRLSGAAHLHAHFGTNPAEVAMLVTALGGPGYSFTVHGPEEFDQPAALKLGRKIEQSRFVVAISSFGRSQLFRWLDNRYWDKVKIVHCGLDSGFATATAGTKTPSTSARPRFVCVGRLCEQKGQLLLVEAASRLRQRGHDFDLVLAGDGEMRSVIEQRIQALDLGSTVRITGWISGDEVREQILASRALVLPSFAEGLPVVLMEAMALARPVVTTYVAGIPELVRDGIDGWLVPAGDIDALVAALETCLACPPQRLVQMGEQAHSRAMERHDITVEAAKLAACFAEAVALEPA